MPASLPYFTQPLLAYGAVVRFTQPLLALHTVTQPLISPC